MPFFPGDISLLIFKRSIRDNIDRVSMDADMLKVLLELDGKKDLSAVGRLLQMEADTLETAIRRLADLRLIEQDETSAPILNAEFFGFLKQQLSLAIGPIAEYIIEDEVREFSDDPNRVPRQHAAELVEQLARQIHRNEKRLLFQQAMIKRIKAIHS